MVENKQKRKKKSRRKSEAHIDTERLMFLHARIPWKHNTRNHNIYTNENYKLNLKKKTW